MINKPISQYYNLVAHHVRVLRQSPISSDDYISSPVRSISNIAPSEDAVNAFNDFILQKKVEDRKIREVDDEDAEREHVEIKKEDEGKKTSTRGKKKAGQSQAMDLS